MLCSGHSDSMPVRLGQFYALLFLLACLVTNIAFFAEVREHFLGDDDPMASVKSAFADLDIQAKIAEFYPAVQSKVDDAKMDGVLEATPPTQLETEKPAPKVEISSPKEAEPVPREQQRRRQTTPAPGTPNTEPFPPLSQQPTIPAKEALPKESEVPKPIPSVLEPERREPNQQTAAAIPVPAFAAVQPVVAEQFKPITVEPKPTPPVRPSANPVWDTMDTILERPIRYD